MNNCQTYFKPLPSIQLDQLQWYSNGVHVLNLCRATYVHHLIATFVHKKTKTKIKEWAVVLSSAR